MTPLSYKIVKTKRAPQRGTVPHSYWRRLFNCMKPGQWFELPAKDRGRVGASAHCYCKGRYGLYKHPQKAGFYVFVKTK